MPVFIGAQQIEPAAAVEAIRALYAGRPCVGIASGRVVARGDRVRLRALAAVDGDVMGAKLHAQARRDSALLVALFAADDGRLLALLDGRSITAARTAATSAVAVDALAPPGPLTLGVLGSGFEARAHVRALATVRELGSIRVFSPTRARREAFAAEIGAQAADDARTVVEASSTVVCAARSQGEEPVLDGNWLRADAVVVSIGSTVPEQRELDVRTLERATVIVADEPEELLTQSGDCIAAVDAGVDVAHKLVVLGEPIEVNHGVRVFKSVGSALQDVAVARLMLEHAEGIPLPIRLEGKAR